MKCAIVTGASAGLGKELSKLLANNGYNLALIGRNEKSLSAMAKEIKTDTAIIAVDLSQPKNFEGLVNRCLNTLGRKNQLALLVNCAGYAVTGQIEDLPEEAIQKCWNVNFAAAVSLCQQAIPIFKDQKSGFIVNVSSGVAKRALPYYSPYCSAKAALNSFTESMRVELIDSAIKVLLFSPGPIESSFHDSIVHYGNSTLEEPPFKGRSAASVANILYRAISRGQSQVTVGVKARVMHHLNYWAPHLTDWLLNKKFRISSIDTEGLKINAAK